MWADAVVAAPMTDAVNAPLNASDPARTTRRLLRIPLMKRHPRQVDALVYAPVQSSTRSIGNNHLGSVPCNAEPGRGAVERRSGVRHPGDGMASASSLIVAGPSGATDLTPFARSRSAIQRLPSSGPRARFHRYRQSAYRGCGIERGNGRSAANRCRRDRVLASAACRPYGSTVKSALNWKPRGCRLRPGPKSRAGTCPPPSAFHELSVEVLRVSPVSVKNEDSICHT